MKKRIMALLMAMTMVIAAVGCGKNYKVGKNGEISNKYVKIKQWKELEVEKVDPTEVTEDDIQSSIDSDLQTLSETVDVTNRAAAKGDQVVIDYVGKKDGVAFDRGSAEDQTITLGKAGFIDGFEDGIVGHQTGETFDLNLTFPEDFGNEELNGQDVVFTITLDKIQEVIVPKLSAEILPKLSDDAKTIDEYKAQVKTDLEKSNKESAEAQMRANAITAFLEQCEIIKYPEDRLKETIETCTTVYKAQLEQMAYYYYGTTLDALKETYGKTEEELLGTTYEEIAKQQLLGELAMELLAEVEGITYTGDVYKEFLKEQAETYGYEDGDAVEKAYEEMYGEGSFQKACLQEKVSAILYEHAVIVEPKQDETDTDTDAETDTTEGTDATDSAAE